MTIIKEFCFFFFFDRLKEFCLLGKRKKKSLKEWDGLQEFDAIHGNTTFNYTFYWVIFNGVINIYFSVLKKMHI